MDYIASLQGKGKVCAEVGVLRGAFTKKIIETLAPSEYWMIDSWGLHLTSFADYSLYDMDHWLNMMKNVEKKYSSQNYHTLRALSTDASKHFDDGHFDFVYIDADHDRLNDDLEAWYPKVKSGGVIAGHDYAFVPSKTEYKMTKVEKDVRDFFNEDFEHTSEVLQSWWHIKK